MNRTFLREVSFNFSGRSLLLTVMVAAMIGLTGCSWNASQLGAIRGDYAGNASMLPDGYVPLRGLDPDNPDHYPDNWPRYIVCEADNMVMTYVDGGTFEMGDGANRRTVHVDPFYIDVHEVTNSQFDRFRKDQSFKLWWRRNWNRPWMESNAFRTYSYEYLARSVGKQKLYPETAENFSLWAGQNPSDIDHYLDFWVPGLNNDDPVRNVSWWEAWLYSVRAGKMLPTEAQWELAARGRDDDRIFPWGSDTVSAPKRCNSGEPGIDDGVQYVASAMAFASGVSPYGCYNMSGNVWEWCIDNYDPHFGSRSRDIHWVDPHPYEPQDHDGGVMDVASKVEFNPVGPLHGDMRALRGGSYTDALADCRVTSRRGARPDVHQMNVGFRCVLPIPVVEQVASRTSYDSRASSHQPQPQAQPGMYLIHDPNCMPGTRSRETLDFTGKTSPRTRQPGVQVVE